jgi:hypothetical protein
MTAPSLSQRLHAVLQLFDDCSGQQVHVTGRSLHGIDERQPLVLRPPFGGSPVPRPLLDLLADGFSAEILPVTRNGQSVADLPFLFTHWKPAVTHVSRGRRVKKGWRVESAAQAAISRALARMPPPSVLIDAAHTVWAAWRLDRPVSVSAAICALNVCAASLFAEGVSREDLADLRLPLAGVIRNWNVAVPEQIAIPIADPTRRYSLSHLVEVSEGVKA